MCEAGGGSTASGVGVLGGKGLTRECTRSFLHASSYSRWTRASSVSRNWCTLKFPTAQSSAMSKFPISSSGVTPATDGMSCVSSARTLVSLLTRNRDDIVERGSGARGARVKWRRLAGCAVNRLTAG